MGDAVGGVYETVVAQELKAHGFGLYYYDNKKIGEVDFLIDDTMTMSALPIEVKSGRDYNIHSALDRFCSVADYHVQSAFVLSNEREVRTVDAITYLPVYCVMFFRHDLDLPAESLRF